MGESTKRCNKCGEEKPLSVDYFQANDKCRNGLVSTCRVCIAARRRELRRQRGVPARNWSEVKDDHKKCLRCEVWKPLSVFSRHKDGRGGRRATCKECRHDEYVANRDTVSKQQRVYYQVNREQILVKAANYGQKNREKIAEYHKRYYAENKERLAEYYRQYRAENSKERVHAARQRRAKIKGADGAHTLVDIRTRHDEQKGCCYWCGDDLNGAYHVDHIIPLSRGGGNGPGNICCSCVDCNLAKADRMPWEFSDRLF